MASGNRVVLVMAMGMLLTWLYSLVEIRPAWAQKSPTGARPAIDEADEYGYTTLHKAYASQKVDAVEEVLAEGADGNIRLPSGDTLLGKAAAEGRKEMVEVLLYYGTKPDALDEYGWTPLFKAAVSRKPEKYDIAKLLLRRGADPKTRVGAYGTVKHYAASIGDARLLELLMRGGVEYPGPSASIPELENFIRDCPHDKWVDKAVDRILEIAAAGDARALGAAKFLAQLEDIDGASYDPETSRLNIFCVESPQAQSGRLPPLLWDDFLRALQAHAAGNELGVSIGTKGRRTPTPKEVAEQVRTNKIPVEYIPEAIENTHIGEVFFEIDRKLKTLSHGEDNLTGEKFRCNVPGYSALTHLARAPVSDHGRPAPFARYWFAPEETPVVCEGYTMKFVGYRMRVRNEVYTDDPGARRFGEHIDQNFEKYAAEIGLFRELVRLHKVVQVARWYHESGFPKEAFFESRTPLTVNTQKTTKRMATRVKGTEMLLMGGINLAPGNRYVAAASVPTKFLGPGLVAPGWRPAQEARIASPPRFGSVAPRQVKIPSWAAPILQSRPDAQSYGWTATVGKTKYVVVSIPVDKVAQK